MDDLMPRRFAAMATFLRPIRLHSLIVAMLADANLQDVESEALWNVIRARAVYRFQIVHKLKQLQELLHQGHNWFDQCEFFLLTSARLDLEHPEPFKVETSK